MVKIAPGAYINVGMQYSMVIFICPILDWKYTFWTNFVQKIKIVNFFPENETYVKKKLI